MSLVHLRLLPSWQYVFFATCAAGNSAGAAHFLVPRLRS